MVISILKDLDYCQKKTEAEGASSVVAKNDRAFGKQTNVNELKPCLEHCSQHWTVGYDNGKCKGLNEVHS